MSAIKYSTTTASNTVKIKNFVIGNDNVPYGPTTVTGFWNTINVPTGGYVIYGNKTSQGPSIYVPVNDTQLINTTNAISGQSFTTFSQCINWFDSQNDTIILNSDVPNITTSGLVLYLDAGILGSYNRVASVWRDISGYVNNGTVSNGATWSNNYFSFDGTDDHIIMSNSTSLSFGATFTLDFWVYPTNLSTRASLFTTRPYSQNANSFTLELGNGNAGTNSVVLSGGDAFVYRSNNNIVALNNWNHVTFVRSGNSSAGVAYVNGLRLISQVASTTYSISDINNDKFIARPGPDSNYFAGRIGEVRIYNEALTQARVTQNYRATRGDYVAVGATDSTFNTGTGLNDGTNGIGVSCLILPDDRILLSGRFTSYNGTGRNRIIMLNPDGTIDSSFSVGTGFNEQPWVLRRSSSGQFVFGGQFTSYNSVALNYIARLNSDGTRDTNFSVGTGFNSFTFGVDFQSDGKIIVSGYFTTYNSVGTNYIVRLNTNGTRDSNFSIGTGFNAACLSCFVQRDDKIIVLGFFTSFNGTARNYITRLNSNGTIDTSFSIGTGFNNATYHAFTQTDGKIICVGEFTTYNGTTCNRIVRLNSNGSIDTSFQIGTGFNGPPVQVLIDSNINKIIVTGAFTTYNGATASKIVRLNLDGTLNESYSTGFVGDVANVLLHSNGNYVVTGYFHTYRGASFSRIVRIEA